MGDFDKVLKENIEAILLPLLGKLLGIRISKTDELKDKLQRTIEREPDYLKLITDEFGNTFILQLEFQTTDDPKMVYRMAEYKAILQRKYELPVKQFVIYLGARPPQMNTELPDEEKITGFELKNIHELSSRQMLDSDVPEEIILTILSDYPEADTNLIIEKIIHKLQKATKDKLELQRSIQQLLILSRLRNLEVDLEKKIKAMPITYDITKDGLYKEGIEQGIEQKKHQIVSKAIKQGLLTEDQIAEIAEVSLTYVRDVKTRLEKD